MWVQSRGGQRSMTEDIMGRQGTTRDDRGLRDCKGQKGTAGGCMGWGKEGGGLRVTARVMSHDAIMIRSEVYDFNLGQCQRPRL